MKVLDLHGVRHEEVERLLENFILLNNPPLKVITGNSNYMQKGQVSASFDNINVTIPVNMVEPR